MGHRNVEETLSTREVDRFIWQIIKVHKTREYVRKCFFFFVCGSYTTQSGLD